jgi:hypothetical protein
MLHGPQNALTPAEKKILANAEDWNQLMSRVCQLMHAMVVPLKEAEPSDIPSDLEAEILQLTS